MGFRLNDQFSAASDQVVPTYDSNYSSLGSNDGSLSSDTLTVRSATGRVEPTSSGFAQMYKASHSGLPTTGTYTATISYFCSVPAGLGRGGTLAYVTGSGGTLSGYIVAIDSNGQIYLRRYNSATVTELSGSYGSVNDAVLHTVGIKVELPDGSTTRITPYIDGSASTPYDDTSGSRLTSGLPGFFLAQQYNDNPSDQYITAFTVDDPAFSGYSPPVLPYVYNTFKAAP